VRSIQGKIRNIISALLLISFINCGGPSVLLEAPELVNEIPEITTGFYTVHNRIDGQADTKPGSEFMGNMAYIYKDEYFIDGKYLTGIKGSFLENNFITARLAVGKLDYFWHDAEDEDISGSIKFETIEPHKLTASITDTNSVTHNVELRFYKSHIWDDEVKTVPIAHRGLSYQPPFNYDGIYPANTLPAFEAALRSGYGGFELDVRVTKDNRFIISHDEKLNVATSLHGNVSEHTLEELKGGMVVKSAAIPEKKSTAAQAYIASPIPPLYIVIESYIDDPRLKTITVDIKPDTDERIISAAKEDFSGLTEDQQKRILFLTRSPGAATGLRELCPHSDIALEGPIGSEPLDEEEWPKFFPKEVGDTDGDHNTISFAANTVLAFSSIETAYEKLDSIMTLTKNNDYKICVWTFSKDWRFDFLRENKFYSDYILSDVPYYQYALQELRFNKDRTLDHVIDIPLTERYENPIYKRLYKAELRDFWFQSRTMMELSYGVGSPSYGKITGNFANVGMFGAKIGRSELNKFSNDNVELNERYLFATYFNSDWSAGNVNDDEIKTESFRFGIGTNDGLGYEGSNIDFVPYLSQALTWTRLYSSSTAQNPEDEETLDWIKGAFRFGEWAKFGLGFEFSSMVQLDVNYETAVVFPRHKFWKWLGSTIIVQGVYNRLASFTESIVDKESVWGPIANWVIKGAYLYGFYLLREDNMNWPFSTDAPLKYDSFNLGISLVLQ
jgi:glycerophosphoryl diester phosphodiesterase